MAILTTKARSANANTPEWVDQSPLSLVAGESYTFTLEWKGAATLASPVHTCFLDGTNVSGTVLSGSTTVEGNVQTLKVFASFTAGGIYVHNIQCSVDGHTEIRKLQVYAKYTTEEQ